MMKSFLFTLLGVFMVAGTVTTIQARENRTYLEILKYDDGAAEEDARMSRVYNRLKDKLGSRGQEALRDEQRDWLKERETNTVDLLNNNGGHAAVGYLIRATRERRIVLENRLNRAQGEDVDRDDGGLDSLQAAYKRADRAMAAVYFSILKGLDGARHRELVESQRDWIAEKESKYARDKAELGHAAALRNLIQETNRRRVKLENR